MFHTADNEENDMRICLTQRQKDMLADERYKGEILVAMQANGYTQASLAEALGMSRTTLRGRMLHPAQITRDEDRRLRRLLGMEGST